MSNYIERIKLLTELFDEGHINEKEFGELVDSLRGNAVNEAYDAEQDKIVLGGGFEIGVEEDYVEGFGDDVVRGFEDYHECKRTDIPETEPDHPFTFLFPESAFTSEDKEFDGAFREYLDSKGEWERVIKTVKGKQVPVWIPVNKMSQEEVEAYERFINNARDPFQNNFYHIMDSKCGPEAYHRINGLAKQDIYSGNVFQPNSHS